MARSINNEKAVTYAHSVSHAGGLQKHISVPLKLLKVAYIIFLIHSEVINWSTNMHCLPALVFFFFSLVGRTLEDDGIGEVCIPLHCHKLVKVVELLGDWASGISAKQSCQRHNYTMLMTDAITEIFYEIFIADLDRTLTFLFILEGT